MKTKLLALVAGLLMASMASAAPLVINGNLSSSDPVFSPNHYYDAYSFTVSQNSFYRLETTAANLSPSSFGPTDTTLFLYAGSFNPLAITTNRIASDDDSGAAFLSRIGINLIANTQYIVVVSGFTSFAQGPYTLEIEGRQGNPRLNDVPEPGTCALLLTGALGLAALKRRRA